MARRPLGLGNARGHRISEGRSVAVRHARSGSRPLARRHVLPRIRCEDRGGSLPRSWCAADQETVSEMRFPTGECALLPHENLVSRMGARTPSSSDYYIGSGPTAAGIATSTPAPTHPRSGNPATRCSGLRFIRPGRRITRRGKRRRAPRKYS